MQLYLLTRTEDADYDEFIGMVIRANNEEQARGLANRASREEGEIWGDSSLVDCSPITAKGVAKIILFSFKAG